jgi:hypothetical protein
MDTSSGRLAAATGLTILKMIKLYKIGLKLFCVG